jgi:hypothetical protein
MAKRSDATENIQASHNLCQSNLPSQPRLNISEQPATPFFDNKRNEEILEELKREPNDEKLIRCK